MYNRKDFGAFKFEMFASLRQDTRSRLRDSLREKSVCVERHRGVLTKDDPFPVAQAELA